MFQFASLSSGTHSTDFCLKLWESRLICIFRDELTPLAVVFLLNALNAFLFIYFLGSPPPPIICTLLEFHQGCAAWACFLLPCRSTLIQAVLDL